MRKVNYKEKGITLIALVITIIILLILAGVTLTTALGQNGLFQRAKYAGEKYKESEADEAEKLGEVEEEIDKIIDGETPTEPPVSNIPEDMKIGDVINYTPDTTEESYELTSEMSGNGENQIIKKETYTWKVLSINDNSVDIMGVPTSGMQEVHFGDGTGYNNGVYYLDDICKTLYSNSKLGVEARSIDLQDIESKMNDSGKKARNEYVSESGIKYGETKTYSMEANYPKLAEYEDHVGIDIDTVNLEGIGESEDGTKLVDKITIPLLGSSSVSKSRAKSKITVKQTYYKISQDNSYYEDKNFYSLVFGTRTNFWLASRYSGSDDDHCVWFGLRRVFQNWISDGDCLAIDNAYTGGLGRIAPVVSLRSSFEYVSTAPGEWSLS